MAARHTCWSTGPALIHILEPKYCQEEWSGGGMEPHLGLPSWWILAMGQGLHWGRAVLSALSLGDLQFCNDYSEHVPACPVAKRSPFNLSAILAFRHSGILAIRLPRCLAARSVLRQTKPQICTNDVVSCCHCPPFSAFSAFHLRHPPSHPWKMLPAISANRLAFCRLFFESLSFCRRRQKVWTHACS